MSDPVASCQKYYEETYQHLCASGLTAEAAIEECAHNYLDGKPQKEGFSNQSRSSAFWNCGFWGNTQADCFNKETLILALGRTLHFGVSNPAIISKVSRTAPNCIMQAMRHSQIFLQAESESWRHFVEVAESTPEIYGDFVAACNYLRETIESLEQVVREKQKPLEELTVFEILLYGSIFTYKLLAGTDIMSPYPEDHHSGDELHAMADILNQLLAWKLKTRPANDLKLSERFLGRSLKTHFSSFIYPISSASFKCYENLVAFESLAQAVADLNDFRSRILQIFCYDDDCLCSFEHDRLVITPIDKNKESEWDKNGRKIIPLNQYWVIRALIEYETSGLAELKFGTAKNDLYNREAYLKATQLYLQLDEIYGLDAELEVKNGQHVNVFRLLHAIELMTVFFKIEHIAAYQSYYQQSGDWIDALRELSEHGMMEGQVRFPLTWAEPEEKARKIQAWTVSEEYPEGRIEDARAILNFWSSDLTEIAEKLKQESKKPIPELYEKPILRLGMYGLQLPWLMATQNNSTAAINNLRRIGGNRSERIGETHRIEFRLGELFEERGFTVVASYHPRVKDRLDPGEVDLLCFRDNHLLILEVKSGYQRKTLQDAWMHKTNTLRKASRQLKNKRTAIAEAIVSDKALRTKLKIQDSDGPLKVYAWIVDTSIEYDQSYINGYLKVSLEGLRIILTDEQQLLSSDILEDEPPQSLTMYPNGFSAARFCQIVEGGELWSFLEKPKGQN